MDLKAAAGLVSGSRYRGRSVAFALGTAVSCCACEIPPGIFDPDCHPNCDCVFWGEPQLRIVGLLDDTVDVSDASKAVEIEVVAVAPLESRREGSGEVALTGERLASIFDAVASVEGPTGGNSFALEGPGIEEGSASVWSPSIRDSVAGIWSFTMPVGSPEGLYTIDAVRFEYLAEYCELSEAEFASATYRYGTTHQFNVVNDSTSG